MIQRVRPYIGTLVAIDAESATEAGALAAIESAFAAIERVGRLLHPRTGTDSRLLCAAPVGERVQLDPWSYELLAVCRELHAASGGVFDPCLPARLGRMDAIDLSVAGCATKLADLDLDLGGIAKGFAVDRAVDALRERGCTSGLVNAGGDLRVFGPARRVIVLRKEGGVADRLELADEALAVSEPKSPRSPPEHLGYYLGTTGERVAGSWAAVSAPSATLADGLVKCAMLCTREVSDSLLALYGARVFRP
jgi:thiamine biosynthesis lipoprotein